MKGMNRLIKVADISKTMQEMQKEMTKAGVIDEMVSQPSPRVPPCRNRRRRARARGHRTTHARPAQVNDAMEALDEDDDEEAADEEVERVMTELAFSQMGGAASAPTKAPVQAAAAAEEEEEEDMSAMRARLEQIKA